MVHVVALSAQSWISCRGTLRGVGCGGGRGGGVLPGCSSAAAGAAFGRRRGGGRIGGGHRDGGGSESGRFHVGGTLGTWIPARPSTRTRFPRFPPGATVRGVAIARAVGSGAVAVGTSPIGWRAADSAFPVDASSPSAAIPAGPTSSVGWSSAEGFCFARGATRASAGEPRGVTRGWSAMNTDPDTTLVSHARRCARAAEGRWMASSARR